jgi:hypothetical protein
MFFATKRRDPLIDALGHKGFKKTQTPQVWMERAVVHPPFPRDPDLLQSEHRRVFRNAIVEAYRSGGWAVIADEVRYLTEFLQLRKEMELLWLQGRSLGVTVVAATQRPRSIPLTAYDQATHLFFWRDNDRENLKRIADMGGSVNPRDIQNAVANLDRHTMLYVNSRTGDTIETRVDVNGR